jgi:hypothetical protein
VAAGFYARGTVLSSISHPERRYIVLDGESAISYDALTNEVDGLDLAIDGLSLEWSRTGRPRSLRTVPGLIDTYPARDRDELRTILAEFGINEIRAA